MLPKLRFCVEVELTKSCNSAVLGANLGPETYTPGDRMGQSVSEYTRWISDSSLKAMSTSGLSSSHTVVLTSGNQAGSSSDIHSYLLPVISQSSPGNQPAIATNVFLILGKNYGQSAFSLSSRIGVSAAQRTSWDSDSSITAMPCDGLSA